MYVCVRDGEIYFKELVYEIVALSASEEYRLDSQIRADVTGQDRQGGNTAKVSVLQSLG